MFNGRIFICADVHGSASAINNVINQIDNPTKDDVIIIAGDAGFEYGNKVMGSAKRAARRFPGKWIVMRGNHDNCYMKNHMEDSESIPVQGWNFYENGQDIYIYQKKYPNILYINDDGGIYTIGNYNFLFLPGAYSVDKWYRLRMGYPYNEDEQLSEQSMNDLYDLVKDWNNNNFPIDYVVGHTFPKWLESYYSDMFLSTIDQASVDKRTEQWLGVMSGEFEKNPSFKMYYGGHMHDIRQLQDKYMMVYQNPIEIGSRLWKAKF